MDSYDILNIRAFARGQSITTVSALKAIGQAASATCPSFPYVENILLLENVPYAMQCENITRTSGIFLELPSQVRHIHMHVVGTAPVFSPPYIGNDLFNC